MILLPISLFQVDQAAVFVGVGIIIKRRTRFIDMPDQDAASGQPCIITGKLAVLHQPVLARAVGFIHVPVDAVWVGPDDQRVREIQCAAQVVGLAGAALTGEIQPWYHLRKASGMAGVSPGKAIGCRSSCRMP